MSRQLVIAQGSSIGHGNRESRCTKHLPRNHDHSCCSATKLLLGKTVCATAEWLLDPVQTDADLHSQNALGDVTTVHCASVWFAASIDSHNLCE